MVGAVPCVNVPGDASKLADYTRAKVDLEQAHRWGRRAREGTSAVL